MIKKLIACPFCGETPKIIYTGNDHTKIRKIKIKCPKCRIERTDAAMQHDFEWLERISIANWNKRWTEETK